MNKFINNLLSNKKFQVIVFILFFILILSKYSNIKYTIIENREKNKIINQYIGEKEKITKINGISETVDMAIYKKVAKENREKEKLAQKRKAEKQKAEAILRNQKEMEEFNKNEYDKKSRPIRIGDSVKIKVMTENINVPAKFQQNYSTKITEMDVFVSNLKEDFISKNIIGARVGQLVVFPFSALLDNPNLERELKKMEETINDPIILNQINEQLRNNKMYYKIKIISITTTKKP